MVNRHKRAGALSRRALLAGIPMAVAGRAAQRTEVLIAADAFHINGRPTYEGREFEGSRIEGLLMNSRVVQGIFDDANPETVSRWAYPDTGRWDADRNTNEFIAAMESWRAHGLLSFTINLQGGSPQGYSKVQPWRNSAFRADGSLKPEYMARLKKILDRADQLGMAPIVGYFYFGQDEHLDGDAAVTRAVDEATRWLLNTGYLNVLVEVANECDNAKYEQPLIQAPNIHRLIEQVQFIRVGGRSLLASASFNGGRVPHANVVKAADFLLVHGNGVKDPARITEIVNQTREVDGYTPKPIVFNEDDHFDFDQPQSNMMSAVRAYASWGYFDPGESNYVDGYQCPPVIWGINTERKKAFFDLLQRVTG